MSLEEERAPQTNNKVGFFLHGRSLAWFTFPLLTRVECHSAPSWDKVGVPPPVMSRDGPAVRCQAVHLRACGSETVDTRKHWVG